MRPLPWLASALVLLPALSRAQDPAPQTPVFRTGVELLTVDVTVVDGDGRQVTDLTPADFTVEVDGDPRTIVTADYVKLVDEAALVPAPRRTQEAAASSDEAFFSTNSRQRGAGRSILLLVNQGNIRAGAARSVMRSAAKFVDGLAPVDRVALVAIPGAGVLVDFTLEHEKVREGLLSIVGQKQAFTGRFNISLTEALATVEHSNALLRAQLMDRECGGAAQSAAEAVRCELEVEQEAGELVTQQRVETQSSMRGMRAVLGSLAALDGPKSVIFISEGMVLEGLTGDLDEMAALAADVRASLDVMLLDVPTVDVTQRQRPTTPREDRDLQEQGLEVLAAMARGTLHRIPASADAAFSRINRSLAGYYLIALEARPADRDGRRHRVQVRTARRGLVLNSRRGFLAATSPAATTPQEAIKRALGAALPLTDMPVRVATWTYKDPGTPRVRVLVAAEIDRLAEQSLDYTAGMVVIDRSGKAVAGGIEARTLTKSDADEGRAVYSGSVIVDPGTYLVRLAFADGEGRIASVERRVDAWATEPGTLAVGDLVVADAPPGGQRLLLPSVEAGVRGRLAALMEVYASEAPLLDGVEATLDILPNESGRSLVSAPMEISTGSSPEVRSLQAEVNTAALPPGRYLARATVRQAGQPKGHILRPFRVLAARAETATAAGESVAVGAGVAIPQDIAKALTESLPAFDHQELLGPEILGAVLAGASRGRPAAVQPALKEAQAGRLGPAALAALEAGDQGLASFLRGLEFLTKNQAERSAQQLQIAMQLSPGFAPARFYLGAALAATGRHREAAGLLQSTPGDLPPTTPLGRTIGEMWLRTSEPTFAVQALERSLAQKPGCASNGTPAAECADARTMRALGFAYVMAGRPVEGVPILERYLEANPEDASALVAAIYGAYVSHMGGARAETLNDDRKRVAAWARAYAAGGGSLQGLVDAWKGYLDQIK